MIGRSHEFTTGHCAFQDTWPITILLPSKSNNAEAVFISVAVQLLSVKHHYDVLLFSKNCIFPFLRNGLAHKIVDSTNRLFVERWLSRVSMIICYDAQRCSDRVSPCKFELPTSGGHAWNIRPPPITHATAYFEAWNIFPPIAHATA